MEFFDDSRPSRSSQRKAAERARRAALTDQQKIAKWVQGHPMAIGSQTLSLDITGLPCGHKRGADRSKRPQGLPIKRHSTQSWVCAYPNCGVPILLPQRQPSMPAPLASPGFGDDRGPDADRAG